MNRKDKDRYLGQATKAAPSRNDQTVAALDKECKRLKTAAQNRAAVKELESTLDLHLALNQLGDFALQRRQAEANIGRQVQNSIALGATWAMIGDRLETTTQAAWSRYHQIRNPQDTRAAGEVLRAGGGISDRGTNYDEELPLE